MSQDSALARRLAYAKSIAPKRTKRPQVNTFDSPSSPALPAAAESSKRDNFVEPENDEGTKPSQPPKTIASQKAPEQPVAQPSFRPELRSSFAKIWSCNTMQTLEFQKNLEVSTFTPNSICLFQILYWMEVSLSDNEQLRTAAPHHFSLPVRVYYAVMFYVQILRAKRAAIQLPIPEDT
ncbi:hypothetical protein K3495_g10429 [Podosphaera aphanis]|nr:hypothetical protein K3495_g10429 [Podosphaera aphanis]